MLLDDIQNLLNEGALWDTITANAVGNMNDPLAPAIAAKGALIGSMVGSGLGRTVGRAHAQRSFVKEKLNSK